MGHGRRRQRASRAACIAARRLAGAAVRRLPSRRSVGHAGDGRPYDRAASTAQAGGRAPPARRAGMSWAWLGVAPFFLFALMFLILPTLFLIVGAFQDADGNFTLANIANLFQPSILSAYWISIKVSAASAIGGAMIGFFLAYAAVAGRPAALDPADADDLLAASPRNFAGVPLAFAFLATLGPHRPGHRAAASRCFGFNIYSHRLQPAELLGPDAHLSLLPDPADGADPDAGARRAEAGMARGLRDPGRQHLAVLALRRPAGPVAEPPRHHAAAVRQRLRRRSPPPTR